MQSRTAGLAAACAAAFATLAPVDAAPLSPPDKGRAEQIESLCKTTAQEQGLTGTAFDQSVQSCVTDQSPNLAYWEKCRQKAKNQHLSGLALSDEVNYCMTQEP